MQLNIKAAKTAHWLMAVLSTAATLPAIGAGASTGSQGNEPSDGAATPVLQEVVVTAERRKVDIQATSISMAAISGSSLSERQVTTLMDLQSQVPNLSVTSGGFTQNVNVRGIGNTTASPDVTTGVPVFRDGLYQPEAILLTEPMYDIADVEVLRGPQGTIVGQNSTGGALIINSNSPNFAGVNGYAQATFGNYNEVRADGAVNLPVNDVLSTRVAFNVEQRDSFFNEIGTNLGDARDGASSDPGSIDEDNLRLSALYRPSDSFQALFKAEINRLDTGGLTGRALPACSVCAPSTSTYQYGYGGPSVYNGYTNPGPYTLVYSTPEMQNDRVDRYSLEMRWTLPDDVVLRSLSGYQYLSEYRVDDTSGSAAPGSAGGIVTYQALSPDRYLSQEFDVISPTDARFTYLFGASYFYRGTPLHNALVEYPVGAVPAPGGEGSILNVSTGEYSRLAGLFGQVTYQLTRKLQLQAGARYNYDTESTGGVVRIADNQIAIPQGSSYSDDVPSGKVALNYTLIPGQFLYAFYARGFKDGGINGPGDYFSPEHVNDYELGWKGDFWQDHLRTQVGGYYMQYDGMQQQVENIYTTVSDVVNLGNSVIGGVEASFQARTGGWSLDGGFAYNHSKLGAVRAVAAYELPNGGSGLLPQCASGVTANCFNYLPYEVNLTGEQNPYSPEWSGNVSVSYAFPLGNLTLAPRLDYSYVGSQYASIFQNTDYYLLQSRRLLAAFLDLDYGRWDVQLFGRNLTNEVYLAGISGTNGYQGDPRTYGISLTVKF